jgi:hypothetical protein
VRWAARPRSGNGKKASDGFARCPIYLRKAGQRQSREIFGAFQVPPHHHPALFGTPGRAPPHQGVNKSPKFWQQMLQTKRASFETALRASSG